jgi:phospholipid/cholesterol/gamma-HCH transport system ATP-binding protein
MSSQKPKGKDDTPVVIAGLRKSFGKQTVLDGIDLSVSAGETVAVLGRSGTGKSVLLKLMIGLQKPDSGSIRILGKEIAGLEMNALNEIRKKLGFLFQQSALYDSLSVEENVAFPLRRHTTLSETERRQRVRELLASVGLERDLGKMPSEISGGMQKRVALARAIALAPEVVLFDEPTTGLDPITASEIGKLIRDLQEKHHITSVVVTHDMHAARKFSNRIVMLDEGKIRAQGTFQDLEQSHDEFVIEYLKEAA